MICNLSAILPRARRHGYAVAAFNVTNLETAQGAVAAGEQQKAPLILQVSAGALRYGGRGLMAALGALAQDASIPIVLHLDHQTDLALIKQGLRWGASSVMYDGSLSPLVRNIVETNKVRALARHFRASIEGEVGTIGGQEETAAKGINLVDVRAAVHFAKVTRVDALALGLGTSHGLPVPRETIHLELLADFTALSPVPVVLHGASNLPSSLVRAGIRGGICKINIDTALRQKFTAAVRENLTKYDDVINPRDYLAAGRDALAKEAARLIKQFGSVNEGHALRRRR